MEDKKPSQKIRLLELLADGRPHSTVEICEVVYGGSHLGLARVGARIWDLKKDGHEINGWHDKQNATLYWYQLKSRARAETIFKAGDIYRPDVLARMQTKNQMSLAI